MSYQPASRFIKFLLVLFFASLLSLTALPVYAEQASGSVSLEWLSWSFFRLTSPAGKVVLTNPWATNPDSKVKVDDITKADIIVVADGHRDEVGEAPEIAIKTKARVVAIRELATGYLKSKGIPENQFALAQPGSRFNIDGITVRVVNSVHGSGVPDPGSPYGGPAAGFFITFENGFTVYFAGSTDLTMDMQLWGSLFKPDVAILILSGDRDPKIVAQMVRLLSTDNPNLKTVIPHHHRLAPPPGAPKPEDLAKEVEALGLKATVLNPEVGKVYSLTK